MGGGRGGGTGGGETDRLDSVTRLYLALHVPIAVLTGAIFLAVPLASRHEPSCVATVLYAKFVVGIEVLVCAALIVVYAWFDPSRSRVILRVVLPIWLTVHVLMAGMEVVRGITSPTATAAAAATTDIGATATTILAASAAATVSAVSECVRAAPDIALLASAVDWNARLRVMTSLYFLLVWVSAGLCCSSEWLCRGRGRRSNSIGRGGGESVSSFEL